MKPEVVYYEREFRSSLFWLVLALFFGMIPLAVYFTSPTPANPSVLLAALVGIPLFALSIADLGRSRGLFLNPGRRQLKYVEGLFSQRKSRIYSYSQVRDLHLIHASSYSGGEGRNCWFLILRMAGGAVIVLEAWSFNKGARLAGKLGSAFYVQPRITPKWVPPPDPDDSSNWSV